MCVCVCVQAQLPPFLFLFSPPRAAQLLFLISLFSSSPCRSLSHPAFVHLPLDQGMFLLVKTTLLLTVEGGGREGGREGGSKPAASRPLCFALITDAPLLYISTHPPSLPPSLPAPKSPLFFKSAPSNSLFFHTTASPPPPPSLLPSLSWLYTCRACCCLRSSLPTTLSRAPSLPPSLPPCLPPISP